MEKKQIRNIKKEKTKYNNDSEYKEQCYSIRIWISLKLVTSIYIRDTRIEIFEENEYKLEVNKFDKESGGLYEIEGLGNFK